MGRIRSTGLGGIVAQHCESLPIWPAKTGLTTYVPSIAGFIALPFLGAAALWMADIDATAAVTGGLLAGVGVLGGLLFQVLAWVSGRLGSLADSMGSGPASKEQIRLIDRLDIARANIAYASLVSIVYVIGLGVVSMLENPPRWVVVASGFLLLHFGATLLLLLVRISQIGQDDRVSALTAHARATSRS